MSARIEALARLQESLQLGDRLVVLRTSRRPLPFGAPHLGRLGRDGRELVTIAAGNVVLTFGLD